MKTAFEIFTRSILFAALSLLFDIVSDKVVLEQFQEITVYLDRGVVAFVAVMMALLLYYKRELDA